MMRTIAALAWLNVIQLLRNPAEVVGVVVLPLVLTMLFGSVFGAGGASAVRVFFVDEDASAYSARVGALIDAEESFAVEEMTRFEAEEMIASGDGSVAVIIPEGFGDDLESGNAEIHVLRHPASENAFAVQSVVQGIAARMSESAAVARIVSAAPSGAGISFDETYRRVDAGWEPQPPVYAVGRMAVASEVRGDSVLAEGQAQSSIGFTVWFILFMTFGSAGGILEEREQGTLRRLLVPPVGRAHHLDGQGGRYGPCRHGAGAALRIERRLGPNACARCAARAAMGRAARRHHRERAYPSSSAAHRRCRPLWHGALWHCARRLCAAAHRADHPPHRAAN